MALSRPRNKGALVLLDLIVFVQFAVQCTLHFAVQCSVQCSMQCAKTTDLLGESGHKITYCASSWGNQRG